MSASADKMQALAELAAAIADSRPAGAVAAAGPVVGYFCSYVPPELLLAGGLYPLRLRGAGVTDSASGDAYLSHLTCSFVRCVTAAVLDGHYDYLAGQISLNTCDHVRRANDVFVAKSGLGFHGYISVPRSFREDLFGWYLEELTRLKQSLEQHFKVSITDVALGRAIALQNQVRERIARLDSLRREDPPRLTGAEMHTAAIASRVLPPEAFIKKADALIAAAQASEPIAGIRARVVLIGGELDDPRFIATLESQGAHVAGDLLCYGVRGLGRPIAAGDRPLEAIARSYLYQVPCARMMSEFPRRYQALLDLYRETSARGVIFQRIKFCQIWSNEVHNLRHRFETEPLPLLVLDREYGAVSTGQLKTRVQAFLERLGA